VFGKVGSTISARPLASATATTTTTTATGVSDTGSTELSLGAKEAASSPVSHTSPWPYFEILIVNRGYYGYAPYSVFFFIFIFIYELFLLFYSFFNFLVLIISYFCL
jgi:hypothetical protein